MRYTSPRLPERLEGGTLSECCCLLFFDKGRPEMGQKLGS
jgi:hypothetical protein